MANHNSTKPVDARVGTVIRGKWTVEGLLGVGGMASVYAAQHRNGQRAALKILHGDLAREPKIFERFLREAYVSNRVNHPATVKVLDDDVTDIGEPFLVMELLEGETVREAWKAAGRVLPAGRVMQICERVLDCLDACHAIKVIHRDLKPANIFITTAGDIKVLDFGVAQMREATAERTATGTALGTPSYMSPEQAMGLVDQLDGRSDIFSVGAMMHALITGQRINTGRTEQEALVMAATKPVPSVARIAPHLPVDLIKAIDKALSWDRRSRFGDAREMQRVLIALMAAEGVMPLGPFARDADFASVRSVSNAVIARVPSQPAGTSGAVRRHEPDGTSQKSGSSPPNAVATSESDPRVVALRDLMKHVDRLLPSVRQLGWSHPATDRALRTAHEAFTETLRTEATLSFALRPYSFMGLGHTVWEPSPPHDAIPYNLFAAGVRTLRLEQGLGLEELRELLALVLLDPVRDLPPEDDLVAALWEKAFPHVGYECADPFAEGDAAERERFFGESDQLERLAEIAAQNHVSALEARAMAVSTDEGALHRAVSSERRGLDEAAMCRLLPLLEIPREGWAERYVDVLVEGYLDAATNRDTAMFLASLRRSSADLVVAGRIDVAITLVRAVIERLRARVAGEEAQGRLATALVHAMFAGETLALILEDLRADPTGVEAFAPVLWALGPGELPTVLASLRGAQPAELRALLRAWIEHRAAGHETELAAAAPSVDAEAGAFLVSLLARLATPASDAALQSLKEHDDVTVRIESRVLCAPSPEHAVTEIAALLEDGSPFVRMAAARAVTRHTMRAAWATVARIVSGKAFAELGSDEQREFMVACIRLSPERGEPLALDLARKGGVLRSEGREATRALAVELLGEHSTSRSVAMALSELSTARWGISEETRTAAASAAKQIGLRLAHLAQLAPGGAPS